MTRGAVLCDPGVVERSEAVANLPSDIALLHSCRQQPEAFGTFYHRHVDQMLAYFWKHTRSHEAAADLTAETFAIALERVESFDPDRGAPTQWLFGIARNLLRRFWYHNQASDRARRRLGISALSSPESGWDAIEAADARLDGTRLAAALERVPVKNREAVRLRVLEELDYQTISMRLGCKPGAARVRVMRGLRVLHVEFERALSRPAPK